MPLPPPGIKILVVDDQTMMRAITKDILNSLGYVNIAEAENGSMALEKLRTDKFDLVMLDWNMPVMQGIDVLKAMREDPKLKDIPVIMVTAEAEKTKVVEALKSGVTNYIVKPFKPSALREKFEQVFSKK